MHMKHDLHRTPIASDANDAPQALCIECPVVRHNLGDANQHFSYSAHYIELQEKKSERVSTSVCIANGVWDGLRQAKVPTKIQKFDWRALHRGIPVGANLRLRGIAINNMCLMCG